MSAQLPLTGERTVPGIPAENYWFRRHEAAYRFVAPLVADRRVLEVGCGEGYGTDLLARSARAIVGIDYDDATVRHATQRYPGAHFARANLAHLPCQDASMEAVVTLQVIEHVWDHAQFVRECRRVLRPGGLFFVTTPNRLTFSPGRETPLNPFHTKEFTAHELVELVADGGFTVEAALGLQAGPRIADLDRRHGSFVDAQLAAPPDAWTEQLLDDVTSISTADFRVDDRGVDESLDLVVLARG